MSEAETPAAASAAATSAENGTDKKKPDGTGKGGPRRKKEDEVPIEELYDLSKPIPRVRTKLQCKKQSVYP